MLRFRHARTPNLFGPRRRPRLRLTLAAVLLTALGLLCSLVLTNRDAWRGALPAGLDGRGPLALADRAGTAKEVRAKALAEARAKAEAEAAAKAEFEAAAAEARAMARAGASLESRLITSTAASAQPTVALTFDDGPHPEWTPQVLDALERHDVKAVFCVLGENAAELPDLVRAIVDAGHMLCNHTFTHDLDLRQRDRAAIAAELTRTMAAIRAAAPGAEVPWYRAPGGFWGERVWDVALTHGMQSLWWAIDPVDWGQPGASAIHQRIISELRPGSVILLHDGGGDRSGTVAALDRLIPEIRERGYAFAMPATTKRFTAGHDRSGRDGKEPTVGPGDADEL